MWRLTGFADEISRDLTEQVALLNGLGISNVEFRSAWGTKVLDLTDAQLQEAKSLLSDHGIAVSSLGTDLGKIQITDPFDTHLTRAAHAMDVASFFGTQHIRLFSFFIPEGDDADSHRAEVMDRSREFVSLAERAGLTLLHENEKDVYGDIPRRVVDLMETMASSHYRAIFDPANYVQCGVKPMDEAYPKVRDYVRYIHIKDALFADHSVTPAGQGDGQIPELLRALSSDGYDGFLSIEPHLGQFDAFGGLCGPELWTTAANALTGLLAREGIQWR